MRNGALVWSAIVAGGLVVASTWPMLPEETRRWLGLPVVVLAVAAAIYGQMVSLR